MTMDVQTSMRLPSTLLDQADALIESLQLDPSLSMMGKMTRSKVLRLALSEGLRALEHQYSRELSLRPRATLPRTRAQEDPTPAGTPINPTISKPYTRSPPATVAMEED
jgi:hypothetical protein